MMKEIAIAAGLGLIAAPAALAATPQTMFQENCSACHQVTGKGIPGAFPALAGDKFVLGDPKPMLAVILNGRAGMPSFKADLSDAEIATIVTYVRTSWGNKGKPVTPDVVAAVRSGKSAPAKAGLQAH